MSAWLYVVTNKVNGKRYVGQTRHPVKKRWREHLKSAKNSSSLLGLAIKKYGPDAFEMLPFQMIHGTTQRQLDSAEKWFISGLGTITPSGYNIQSGGYGHAAGTFKSRGFYPEARLKANAARAANGYQNAKNSVAVRRKNGFPELRRGLATRAANGYASVAKGRQTQAASGYPALRKGLETNAASGFQNLKLAVVAQAALASKDPDYYRRRALKSAETRKARRLSVEDLIQ